MEDLILLEEEALYRRLVSAIRTVTGSVVQSAQSDIMAFLSDTDKSQILRSKLLQRNGSLQTTWDEVFFSRLQFDCPLSEHIQYDSATCRLHVEVAPNDSSSPKPGTGRKAHKTALTERLLSSLKAIARGIDAGSDEIVKKLLNSVENLPSSSHKLVRAIHGLPPDDIQLLRRGSYQRIVGTLGLTFVDRKLIVEKMIHCARQRCNSRKTKVNRRPFKVQSDDAILAYKEYAAEQKVSTTASILKKCRASTRILSAVDRRVPRLPGKGAQEEKGLGSVAITAKNENGDNSGYSPDAKLMLPLPPSMLTKVNTQFTQFLQKLKLNGGGAKVSVIPLIRPGDTSAYSNVIKIENVFNTQFISRIVQNANDAAFARGVDGRQSSYIRISTISEPPCPFIIGRTIYESVAATPFEDELIDYINSCIMVGQNDAVRKQAEDKHCTNPYVINMLQMVLASGSSSGYGDHSDTSPLLNSNSVHQPPTAFETFGEYRLPTREEQQTITIVITDRETTDSHEITWRTLDDNGGWSVAGRTTLSGNTMHIQTHGSQHGTVHRVKSMGKAEDTVRWRLVISGRLSGNCGCSPLTELQKRMAKNDSGQNIHLKITRENYFYKGVVSAVGEARQPKRITLGDIATCRNSLPDNLANDYISVAYPRGTEITVSDTAAETGHEISVVTSLLDITPTEYFPVPYKQLHSKTYAKYNIYRATPSIAARECASIFFASYYAARSLVMRCNVMPRVSCVSVALTDSAEDKTVNTPGSTDSTDSSGKEVPGKGVYSDVFFRWSCNPAIDPIIPQPLQLVTLENIASLAGIPHNPRSKPPICTASDRLANVAILTSRYKNDIGSIKATVEWLGQLLIDQGNVVQGDELSSDTRECPMLLILGSGGAPRETAAYRPDAANVTKQTPSMFMATGQDLLGNRINSRLLQCCTAESVLAVFVSIDLLSTAAEEETSCFPTCERMHKSHGNDDGVFLGYFWIEKAQVEAMALDSIRPLYGNEGSTTVTPLARFRERKHLTCYLRPVFSVADLQLLQKRVRADGDKWEARKVDRAANVTISLKLKDTVETKKFVSLDPTSTSCQEFIDRLIGTGAWRSYFVAQEGRRPCAKVDQEGNILQLANRSTMGSRGTMFHDWKDAVALLHLLFDAGARRFCRQNIQKDSRTATPLDPGDCLYLGSVLRAHPMPMPIRTYDPMPLLLRSCATNLGLLQSTCDSTVVGERAKMPVPPDKKAIDMLFRACVLRFTGRVANFVAYGKWRNKQTTAPAVEVCCVPSRDEYDVFHSFVNGLARGKTWLSEQHKGEIPLCLRNGVDNVLIFLGNVAGNIGQHFLDLMAQRGTRKHALRSLAQFFQAMVLKSLNPRSGGRSMMFIAGQIIADMEEIYDEPFGSVGYDSIVCGSGSAQGIRMLPGVAKSWTNNDQMTTLLNKVKSDALDGDGRVAASMGLSIIHRTGADEPVLVVSLNGRPFNPCDAEHMMCKLYTAVYKTIGDRAVVRQPAASRHDMHPINSCCDPFGFDRGVLSDIMNNAIVQCSALAAAGRIVIPDVCLIDGEPHPAGDELQD